MRVLYLGYWGSSEPLTTATILPSLRVLGRMEQIEKIIYCSIERTGKGGLAPLPKVEHVGISSWDTGSVMLTKLRDYRRIYDVVQRLCRQHDVDLLVCRSALAGAFGHRVKRKFGIPYVVESFEPHKDYMVESHVWGRYDVRALMQSLHERQQKKSADVLLPVSSNYLRALVDEGLDERRVLLLPCCVDLEMFSFDAAVRDRVRRLHSFGDTDIVGIYVGKFGGIYYDREAYTIFKKAFDHFGMRFKLVVLTNDNRDGVLAGISRQAIPTDRVVVTSVPHNEVNEWLCAADIAFCTVRPAASRKYCSPVKNGEYWACGLPVVIEPGIGDDSDIVDGEGGGVLVRNRDYATAFGEIEKLIDRGRERLSAEIRMIAIRHRDSRQIESVYRAVFERLHWKK